MARGYGGVVRCCCAPCRSRRRMTRPGLQPRLDRQRGQRRAALLDLASAAPDLPRTSARRPGRLWLRSASSGTQGEPVPVGFSIMTLGAIPRVAPNCALLPPGQLPARAAATRPQLVSAGPGTRVDPQAYIRFLIRGRPRPALHRRPIMRGDHGDLRHAVLGAADLPLVLIPRDPIGAAQAGARASPGRTVGRMGAAGGSTRSTPSSFRICDLPRRRHHRQLRHDAALGARGDRPDAAHPQAFLPLGRAANGPRRDGRSRGDRRRNELQVVAAHEGHARPP